MSGYAKTPDPEDAILPMTLEIVQTSTSPAFEAGATRPESRDLGLGKATAGVFNARRARAGAPPRTSEIASAPGAWFSFVYVLGGTASLRVNGASIAVKAHDAFTQVPVQPDTLSDISAGFEFLEISAADSDAVRRILPERPQRTIALDSPEAHILGTGPRSFFDYRDLGVANATNRKIDIQIVRAQRPRDGGTGWHWHNMAQLSYGLSGWAMLNVQGYDAPVRQGIGDAFSIPSHWRHNASSFSADYWALQLQIPADFETFQDNHGTKKQ